MKREPVKLKVRCMSTSCQKVSACAREPSAKWLGVVTVLLLAMHDVPRDGRIGSIDKMHVMDMVVKRDDRRVCITARRSSQAGV